MSFGATSLREPADQFHGSRSASITDPFGQRWTLSTLIETLSTEEYASRAARDEGHGSFSLQTADGHDGDTVAPHHQAKVLAQGDL
jgi:hypothetical protein